MRERRRKVLTRQRSKRTLTSRDQSVTFRLVPSLSQRFIGRLALGLFVVHLRMSSLIVAFSVCYGQMSWSCAVVPSITFDVVLILSIGVLGFHSIVVLGFRIQGGGASKRPRKCI